MPSARLDDHAPVLEWSSLEHGERRSHIAGKHSDWKLEREYEDEKEPTSDTQASKSSFQMFERFDRNRRHRVAVESEKSQQRVGFESFAGNVSNAVETEVQYL